MDIFSDQVPPTSSTTSSAPIDEGASVIDWSVPPEPETRLRLLCGYLKRQENLGLRRTWRNRWFVFDDTAGKLTYYGSKTDLVSLGQIDICNAQLRVDADNCGKGMFQIITPNSTHFLQAQNKEAMQYWLDQLQKKRKVCSLLRKNAKRSLDNSHLGALPIEGQRGLVDGGEERGSSPLEGESPEHNEEEEEASPPPSLHEPVVAPSEGKAMQHMFSSIKHKLSSRTSKQSGNDESSKFYVSAGEEMSGSHDGMGKPPSEASPMTTRRRKNTGVLKSFKKSPAESQCAACNELRTMVGSLNYELKEKDREVQDRDDICDFLRVEIRKYDHRAKVQEEMLSKDAKALLEQMTEKEAEIAELRKKVESLQYDTEQARAKADSLERARMETEEQLAMYKETVKVKDDVVVQLTNTIFQLENKGQVHGDPRSALLPPSQGDLQGQVDKLKESVEAYREVNIFLSKEVSELYELRSADQDRISELRDKNSDLDAELVQITSKMEVLLYERDTPFMNSAGDLEVSERLKEAMESGAIGKPEGMTSSGRALKPSGGLYGFKPSEDEDLNASFLQNFEQLGVGGEEEMDPQTRLERQVTLTREWGRFLQAHAHGAADGGLPRSPELKLLVRRGIPEYRSQVWRLLVQSRVKDLFVVDGYKNVLEYQAGKTSPALGQIELDLLRTLPNNIYFDSRESKGIDKLRRVLVAFSWYNPEVGYCQGLNRLAAISLLFLDEEWAFWCIVAVVERIMPKEYYTKNLIASQADQRVLRALLHMKAPRVAAHLETCNIDYSLITFNWFLTVFVDNIPPDTMVQIWDTFLYEGDKVLFRFAIAIFKYYEERIIQIKEPLKLYSFLRQMSSQVVNVPRLKQIAFVDLNPFPRKKIHELRCKHQQDLQNEVAKLEEVRLVHLAKMQEKMAKLFPNQQTEENLDGEGDAGSEEEADECDLTATDERDFIATDERHLIGTDERDLMAFGGSDEEGEEAEGSKVTEPLSGGELSSDPPSLL